MEIRDITTGLSTFDCITPKARFNVVSKNDDRVFFTSNFYTSETQIDIFNTTNNSWSIGMLPFSINAAAIISVNNTIYVAGGMVGGIYSDKVWKLEF